jgi:outer membrane protein OmpA-like peptidoglycan-associated protein
MVVFKSGICVLYTAIIHNMSEVRLMKLKLVWLALLLVGIAQAEEMEFQVEIMNRVGTETNRKGDLVSARVVAPAGFQGSVLEGKVTESKSGAKSGGESVLDIDFDILRHNNNVIPINSKIKSVGNSKGQVNVDEDGRVIGRAGDSNRRSSGTGGLGRAIGGIAGGRAARIGSAVDTGASVLIRVSADAPNLRFDPGSKFTLAASARSGPALATLASSSPAAAAAPASPAAPAPASTPQSSGGPAQPNFTSLKDEFMPGENTIFYDDFTDMAAGDAPPHFKVRGASPDLKAAGNIRQLTINAKGTLIPNLTSLPKNFTYEAVIKIEPQGRSDSNLILISNGKQVLHWWISERERQLDVVVSMRAPYQELGRKRVAVNVDQPIKLALWVQNGRMRSYINGEKALDFNQVELPPINGVELENGLLGAGAAFGFRMVRFAESTPDFSQVIASSGRYIARGILFDTDSDVIKPESAPVIRQIAKGLETNPNLKLVIEGHTDSVGDSAHNLDLSLRRAAAVRSVLITQFNIDAYRLAASGLGSTKPVDTNDTPQGRAQNRRVELVKQ